MLPLGRDGNTNWDYLNSDGLLLVQRAIAWAMGADDTSIADVLLVVVDPGNLTAQEAEKQALMESWNFTVNLIDESDSQAEFDAAFADNDVAYIPQDINSSNLGTKLRNATIGVVNEEGEQVDELGFSSDKLFKTRQVIDVVDNSHYITQSFATGLLTFVSSDQSVHMLAGTIAPGLQTLGESSNVGSQWEPSLGTLDTGDDLSGGGTAAGRRVQLPWGGGTFDINQLNDDGRTIMQRALEWGAGAETVATGPLAHWKLDETSGLTAVDSIGGHDGTLANGPSWTSGQLDGGLDFDGADDTVDAGSASTIDDVFAGGGTLAGWIYPRSWGGGAFGRIADKADALGANRNGWAFELYGSPRAMLFQYGFSGNIGNWYTPTDSVVLDTWQHVAVVYDNSADTNDPTIYIDGVAQPLTELDTPVGTTSSDAANDLHLGNYAVALSRAFDGVLDDIRLYGRMLSATEIAELAVPPPPGPIAHWKLDETSGSTAADSVGGNDGTLNGVPVWTPGTIDGGLDFDGSNDYVATNSSFAPPPAGTVSFWMQVSGSPAAHGRILGLHDTWEIRHVTTGTADGIPYGLVFDLGVTGVNTEFATSVTIDVPDRWYHIAASYDTATDAYAVYIDGVPHTSGTYSSPLSVPAANNLSLGTRTGSSNYYDGMLDDVRIYDQVLTPEQVAELAAQGGGGGGLTCTFRDEFDVASYSNQDGDALWAGDWQEVNDGGSPSGGDILIEGGGNPGNSLRIQDDDRPITRAADLSDHTNATLTLEYKRVGLEDGEYVAVSVFDGSSWTELAQFGNPPVGNESDFQSYSQDISAYISPNFQIQLASPAGGMGNADDVKFDNLQIEATGGTTCP